VNNVLNTCAVRTNSKLNSSLFVQQPAKLIPKQSESTIKWNL